MQIIVLIGKPNCGKTTTCRSLYNGLISCGAELLKLNDGVDFSCSLKFCDKKVAIKSAGDSRYRVQSAIDKYSKENFDVLICTCRANFTDMINFARQTSNGNCVEINKEIIPDEDTKNHIINILKS